LKRDNVILGLEEIVLMGRHQILLFAMETLYVLDPFYPRDA
jgi:hypothetical protein